MDGIGSSVIIALAAVMWFLYLIPTWLKRQEYLATERNAVRLQQTMRILAESAEMPSVVRVEATARTVAAQQRALRQQERLESSRAFSRQVYSLPAVSVSDQAQRTLESGVRTRRRLRRSRVLAFLVLVAAIVGVGFGLPAGFAGNWLLLLVSIGVGAGAVALLGQAATVTRARADLRQAAMSSAAPSALHDQADHAPVRGAGWTPVPVPKPLYLSTPAPAVVAASASATESVPAARSARSHVSAATRTEVAASLSDGGTQFDHVSELRAASAESELALRAAQASPQVARISPPPVNATQAASRFASMGVIDPTQSQATDLDEVLRRRRAAG